MTEETKPPRVDSTLTKGLAILENLAASPSSKGVTQLSKELGLTKSNTFRLLQTLSVLGYVRHGRGKSYAATLKTWQVGRHAIESLNLREISAAQMNQLSVATGEAIYLAVPENLSVVYISKIDGLKPIRSWNSVGGSAPMHCVGTGKAILSANYAFLRDSVKSHLDRYTVNTLTSINLLDADMALTAERGYAFDTGEFRDRILSFGAAICLPGGEAIGALGISLPDVNLADDGEQMLGALVRDAARKVSVQLAQGA